MPYKITKKCPSCKCYKVINLTTNHIHAKCTTLEKAKKQVRLLNAIHHGFILNKKYIKKKYYKN